MELNKNDAETQVTVYFVEDVQDCVLHGECVTVKEEPVDGSSVQGHDEPDLIGQSCDDGEGRVCNLTLGGSQNMSSESSVVCSERADGITEDKSVQSVVKQELEPVSDEENQGQNEVEDTECSVERLPGNVAMFEGDQLYAAESDVAASCPICNKVYRTKNYLPKHMKRCHGVASDKSVSCPVCNKVVKTTNHLHRHMKRHEQPKVSKQSSPVACPVCNKQIRSKSYLKTHIRLHTGERIHRCTLCPKTFITEGRLTYHHQATHEKRPLLHKCNYCPRRFLSVGQLETHTKGHETGQYQCSVCQKHLSCNKSLRIHLRSHTGEKPYSCPICQAAFRQVSHLKTHELTHTGEKTYKCTLCDMKFGIKSALSRHLKIHAGVKPHSCPECDCSFRIPSAMKSHMLRKHSPVKHFKCSVCPRAYSCKADLLSHEKIHSGNNPYTCAICGKPFRRRAPFVRHVNTHSRSKPFGCQLCAATFRLSRELNKHIKIAHKACPSVSSAIKVKASCSSN